MNAAKNFEYTFGSQPLIVASAPGRVNLIGEHTDYNGGAVLPAALDRQIHVAMARRDTPTASIKSSRFASQIDRTIGETKRGDWTDYVMGALSKATERGWLDGGVALHIDSDVPDGAGVSSSAALITAVFRAITRLSQVDVTPIEIAQQARAVENDYIGMPCGIMDQMAVGLADPGTALALDTRDLSYEIVPIPEDWTFAVIHSGVRRELTDGRYKARFEECRQATSALNADALCRLDQSQMSAVANLPETLRKRARHALSEHRRTVDATSALKARDISTFARLMNESHHSYADDFEASTPVIDALVKDTIANGAIGARLTGGGFGGCIVALYPAATADRDVAALLNQNPTAWRV